MEFRGNRILDKKNSKYKHLEACSRKSIQNIEVRGDPGENDLEVRSKRWKGLG